MPVKSLVDSMIGFSRYQELVPDAHCSRWLAAVILQHSEALVRKQDIHGSLQVAYTSKVSGNLIVCVGGSVVLAAHSTQVVC
jgi:hypothetical protein